jgi:hemerythrin superfamily protein
MRRSLAHTSGHDTFWPELCGGRAVAIHEPSTLPAKSAEKGQPGDLDVVMLLARDHRAVQQALNDYQRAKDPEQRVKLIRHVMSELKQHEAAEKQAWWPAVRREVPNGERLASEGIAEEERGKRVMAELEQTSQHDPAWDAKVQSFIADVLNHASREEREVLAPAREKLPVSRLLELGRDLERAKKRG